ncbi:MAG: thiolase C-terminal domain-containing protein [Rhodoglobus sp.]
MGSIHNGAVAIVGASETTELGRIPGMSVLDLHADGARNALRDAGLSARDVDGVITAGPLAMEVSDYLGIRPRFLDGTMVGGGSFMLHVRHAAAAIASGAASVVLITHGESGRSRVGAPGWDRPAHSLAGQFEMPFGALAPYSTFTVPALRFLHDRGMHPEDLAAPVVAQRVWASGTPRALKQELISEEEVLSAPMVAYPFTKEMCCLVTDGGGALVMVSAERAADLPSANRAIYLHGSGEAAESPLVSQMADVSSFESFTRSSQEAFASARLSHSDVDHLMVYDAFSHLPLYGLEDLGFVGRGESAQFIRDGHTLPGGKLPMNTNGGGLSYTHTGMYGMFAIQEAVRQLRGEAAMQVAGARISFVQGVGLFFATAGALILSNERVL